MIIFILKLFIIVGIAIVGGLLISLIEQYEHEQAERDQQTIKKNTGDNNER